MARQVPRDDRAWPRGSFAVSLAFVAAALVVVAVILAVVDDRGTAVLVVGAFALVAALSGALYAVGMRDWLRGDVYPARVRLPLAVLGLVGVGLLLGDGRVGGSALAGLAAGMFGANAWAIRAARANRDAVDAAEAEGRLAREPAPPEAGPAPQPRDPVDVGRVLHEQVGIERRRAAAWLVAGAVGAGAFVALRAPEPVVPVVAMSAVVCVGWVLRRLTGAWLAVRDLTRSADEPRRAFVVLLDDPAPRVLRPLLAVWAEAPVVAGGRLPRPDAVYRSDDELLDLLCYQGEVVVHEAWVDTGPRSWSKPRWVAADAGVALPHRKALFGRWYVGTLVRGERPGPPRALRMPRPRPGDEVGLPGGSGSGWARAIGGRLAGLGLIGFLLWWLI